MRYDPVILPFSVRGSWLGFSVLEKKRVAYRGLKPGLYLRTMQGAIAGGREVVRIDLLRNGRPAAFRPEFSASGLDLNCGRARAAAAFADPRHIVLEGRGGCGIALEAEPVCYATLRGAGPERWEMNLMAQRIQLMISVRRGRAVVTAPWKGAHSSRLRLEVLPDETGRWSLDIEEFLTAWEPAPDRMSLQAARRRSREDFLSWLDAVPPVPSRWKRVRELAAYVQWTSLVAPRGFLQRETMLMSKNWMTNVWSWDHCFNALALVRQNPSLAWDQWAVLFDLQNEAGALPDCANNADVVWNFCKPPVHGWALSRMRSLGLKLSAAQARQACGWLERWTEWWLRYRDEDGDGLPQYNHGNDSGWDNATCFGHGMPVEGPDLAAFLILQMEEISRLRSGLGQHSLASRWSRRAKDLLKTLNEHSWRGDHFIVPRSGDHALPEGDSLVPFLPLVLARRLTLGQRGHLIRGLRRFLTPYGIATENPASALYEADGYWRGPVWAPTTYLIVDALRECGESALANSLSLRFCRACAKGGMAENFDALTGAGLRDRAYSWTASVFLLLASSITAHDKRKEN